jgi:hypothetical protein
VVIHHPRDDVSLPFLPERRMAIPYYRASLLGLVKKANAIALGSACWRRTFPRKHDQRDPQSGEVTVHVFISIQ